MNSIALHSPVPWFPDWAIAIVVLSVSAGAAVAMHALLLGFGRRITQGKGPFLVTLFQRTEGVTRLAFVILGIATASSFAPIAPAARVLLRLGLLVGFIVLVGWATLAALHIWAVIYTRRFELTAEDNLVARKHLTQVQILERTAAVLIVLLTLAAAMMTIPAVRQYGVTLLASAGAAGIIAGLALQPLLTNLIAGIQIAITQPIRIDDAVIVENEWGWVEEITATYVVVRLWDLRRMILPLAYFMQNPFQNWTRENASLIGTAIIYVDYSAPVDAMREKLKEIAQSSRRWDGAVVNLAVTDLSERTMQVRCLISAKNAGETFDLRCEVRERMVGWLNNAHPEALPRERFKLNSGPETASAEAFAH